MTIAAQTGLADRLRISEREWILLADILHRQIPEKAVWAFGSRATGKHIKRFSDLDLAIAGRLTPAEHAAISEALDEAPINFKVDLVELDLVDADFRKRIEPDFIRLQGEAPAHSDSLLP
jgi:predicted nucleotidyltransferase